MPCVVCSQGTYHEETGESLCDPHHVKARGMGGGQARDMENVVPLCRRHHTLVHTMGLPRFQDSYDVALFHVAKRVWQKWRVEKARREMDD